MRTYKTKKGYFYKEYKNGKKKRISKEEHQKLKKDTKKVVKKTYRKQKGGESCCVTSCPKELGMLGKEKCSQCGNNFCREITDKVKSCSNEENMIESSCGSFFCNIKQWMCKDCISQQTAEIKSHGTKSASKTARIAAFKGSERHIVEFYLTDVDFNQELFYITKGKECYKKIYGNASLNTQQNENHEIRERLQPLVNECIKFRNNKILRSIVNVDPWDQNTFYNTHGEDSYKQLYGNASLNTLSPQSKKSQIRQKLHPYVARIYREGVSSGKINPIWSTENNNCQSCNEAFSMKRSAHHCRWCGLSICKDCMQRGLSKGINPLIKSLPDYIKAKKKTNSKSSTANIPFCKDLCFNKSTEYQIESTEANRGVRARTNNEEEAQRFAEQQQRNRNCERLSQYQEQLLINKETSRGTNKSVSGHGLLSNTSLIRNIKSDIIKVKGIPETNTHLETNWESVDWKGLLEFKAPPVTRVNKVNYSWRDCLVSFKTLIYYYFEYKTHLFSQQLVTKQPKLMSGKAAETAAAALKAPAENKQIQKLRAAEMAKLTELLPQITALSNDDLRSTLVSMGFTPGEAQTIIEIPKNDIGGFGEKLLLYKRLNKKNRPNTQLSQYINSLEKLKRLDTQGINYLRNLKYHNIDLWKRDIDTLKRFKFSKFKFRGPNEKGTIQNEDSSSGLLIGLKRVFLLIDKYATYEPTKYMTMLETYKLLTPHRNTQKNCHQGQNMQEWNVRCNLYLKYAFGLKIREITKSNDTQSSIQFVNV